MVLAVAASAQALGPGTYVGPGVGLRTYVGVGPGTYVGVGPGTYVGPGSYLGGGSYVGPALGRAPQTGASSALSAPSTSGGTAGTITRPPAMRWSLIGMVAMALVAVGASAFLLKRSTK